MVTDLLDYCKSHHFPEKGAIQRRNHPAKRQLEDINSYAAVGEILEEMRRLDVPHRRR